MGRQPKAEAQHGVHGFSSPHSWCYEDYTSHSCLRGFSQSQDRNGGAHTFTQNIDRFVWVPLRDQRHKSSGVGSKSRRSTPNARLGGSPEAALVVSIGGDTLTGPPGGRIVKISAVHVESVQRYHYCLTLVLCRPDFQGQFLAVLRNEIRTRYGGRYQSWLEVLYSGCAGS